MILHIVRKDARRLWPQIAISLALLMALAFQDGARVDAVPGAAEGGLSLALPLVWACLLALAVQQESPADDRQFWITRPYRRGTLLASKLVFTALFVHLPALMGAAAVMMARGFSPWAGAVELVRGQLVLAVVLTIPALAVAALFPNPLQFLFAAIAVPAAAVWATGLLRMPWGWGVQSGYESGLALLLPAAVAILLLQYLRRRLWLTRGIGVAAALAAILLCALAPPRYAYALRSKIQPGGSRLSVRIDTTQRPWEWHSGSPRGTIAIPIALDGAPDRLVRLQHLDLQIVAEDGTRISSVATFRDQAALAYTTATPAGYRGLALRFDVPMWARVTASPVKLRGSFVATFYEKGATATVPVGQTAAIPGVGRCSSFFEETIFSRELKAVCSSPGGLPEITWVRLEAGSEHWDHFLGDASTHLPGPRDAFLSPVERRQTVFHMAEMRRGAGSQWLVPEDVVGRGQLRISSERAIGYELIDYDFGLLDLKKWAR